MDPGIEINRKPPKMPLGMKTCTKCGKTKSVPEFSCGGKRAQCKQCVAEYQRAFTAGKKKHECKTCGAKFRSSDTLVEHEKIRHAS
jgi:predicted nucleic acid-binding Zn ribbon protein